MSYVLPHKTLKYVFLVYLLCSFLCSLYLINDKGQETTLLESTK